MTRRTEWPVDVDRITVSGSGSSDTPAGGEDRDGVGRSVSPTTGPDRILPEGPPAREPDRSRHGSSARGGGRDRLLPPALGTGITVSSGAGQDESPRDPAERARAVCLRLITGAPRTRGQLAEELRRRRVPDDVAEEVLDRFEQVGLIDDVAFAHAWVESRHHGRGLASRALARELRTKGVAPDLVDAAVSRIDSDQEEATARELVGRKLRATRGLDRDKRLRRLAGMLARKGYPEGLALRVVRQALREEGEEVDLPDEGV
ncbi:recombination regulator RecX [Streptomyces sp. ZYX-F-203]